MQIIEYKISDTNISWEDLARLMRESFKERTEQGLLFACRNYSDEELKEVCNNSEGFIFVKKDELGNILGFIVLTIINNAGYTNYVVASPSSKNTGVCSSIFEHVLKKSKELNLDYISSSTSTKATSSVNWHLKMGFEKYDYQSSKYTNYYSCIFRYQLKDTNKLSYTIKRLLHFHFAKMFITIMKTPNGTWRFPLLIKIFRKIKH